MIHDKQTRLPRGFGFVTFSDDYTADQVVSVHFHEFMGKMVEVKRAEPKPTSDVVLPVQQVGGQAGPHHQGASGQRSSMGSMGPMGLGSQRIPSPTITCECFRAGGIVIASVVSLSRSFGAHLAPPPAPAMQPSTRMDMATPSRRSAQIPPCGEHSSSSSSNNNSSSRDSIPAGLV